MTSTLCGLVLIDKAEGLTSHSVVNSLRRILNIRKIGHLGTLDPFASGLLPILIGGANRLAENIMDGKKQYLFTIRLGVQTDTLDLTGRTIAEKKVPEYYWEKIEATLPQFLGNIEQIPPAYSALKMNGRPLYEYMRATGELPVSIETKKRSIYIEKMEIVSFDRLVNTITLRVLCGKGTYIRSLSRDIAFAIDTVGHCVQLRREFVEPWSVNNAISFSEEKKPSQETILENIIYPEQILPNILKITLDPSYITSLNSGNILSIPIPELELKYPQLLNLELNNNKIFLCVNGFDILYLSEVEFLKDENICKLKPKKKII